MKNKNILHSEITDASKSAGRGVSKKLNNNSYFFKLPETKARLVKKDRRDTTNSCETTDDARTSTNVIKSMTSLGKKLQNRCGAF